MLERYCCIVPKYPWLRIACALDRQVLKLVHRCFERLRIGCSQTCQWCIPTVFSCSTISCMIYSFVRPSATLFTIRAYFSDMICSCFNKSLDVCGSNLTLTHAGGASNHFPIMAGTAMGVLKDCYKLGVDLWERHRKVAAISSLHRKSGRFYGGQSEHRVMRRATCVAESLP